MTLCFATFNLKNLQSPGRPMYRTGTPYDEATYEAKIAWTAAMLRRLDADVIGFQEAWSVDSLTDAFARAGLAEEFGLIARDAPAERVQVALAYRRARFTPVRHAWTETVPPNFLMRSGNAEDETDPDGLDVRIRALSRPPLMARLRLRTGPYRNREIAVWVAHLKSKRPTDLDAKHYRRPPRGQPNPWAPIAQPIGSALSSVRRAAEALALRMMLTEQMLAEPDLPVVVTGDLNDATLSVTTSLVAGDAPYKLWAKSTAGQKGRTAQLGLYNAETLQEYRSQRDVTYTHIFQNRMETLDHVLVSRHFYDHSPERLWSFRELHVWNDHLQEGRAVEGGAAGDHGVVAVHFDNNRAPAVEGDAGAVAAAFESNA
jgi:predicted extracellular nuclease